MLYYWRSALASIIFILSLDFSGIKPSHNMLGFKYGYKNSV